MLAVVGWIHRRSPLRVAELPVLERILLIVARVPLFAATPVSKQDDLEAQHGLMEVQKKQVAHIRYEKTKGNDDRRGEPAIFYHIRLHEWWSPIYRTKEERVRRNS